MEDSLWTALTDSYGNTPMAITAENLAKKYGVSREECDEFALASQDARARVAKRRVFCRRDRSGAGAGSERHDAYAWKRTKARARDLDGKARQTSGAFRKRRRRYARQRERNHRRRGRRRADDGETGARRTACNGSAACFRGSVVGVDPSIMGIGPAFSIPKALEKAGIGKNDLAVMEINEAFAPQVLACLAPDGREAARTRRSRLNPHGGAIALGHPLGRFRRTSRDHDAARLGARGGGYGVASACIGGGQGIAALLRVD